MYHFYCLKNALELCTKVCHSTESFDCITARWMKRSFIPNFKACEWQWCRIQIQSQQTRRAAVNCKNEGTIINYMVPALFQKLKKNKNSQAIFQKITINYNYTSTLKTLLSIWFTFINSVPIEELCVKNKIWKLFCLARTLFYLLSFIY